MPKEIIHSCQPFGPETARETGIAELRWSRDSEYCQIATLLVDKATHSSIEGPVNGGWYISLDRHGINTLIRNLRRARDQAFGRDE
jgi:hypothetical protein